MGFEHQHADVFGLLIPLPVLFYTSLHNQWLPHLTEQVRWGNLWKQVDIGPIGPPQVHLFSQCEILGFLSNAS